MRALRALLASFSYFSVLPVPSFDVPPTGAAIGWLPFVGFFAGGVAGAFGSLVFRVSDAPLWAIVVAFAASIVLTGAIHFDGFLDTCDALLATVPFPRRLEILRDPRHGTYAVTGAIVLVVIWLTALASIPPSMMPVSLAIAAIVARASVVALPGQYPHARTGARFDSCRFYGSAWFLALLVLAAATREWHLLVLVVGAFILTQTLAALAARRLGGGLTGDVYGAIVTVVEVVVLIALPFAGISLA